jgi:hypothetical protein
VRRIPNTVQVGERGGVGVDGRIFPVGTKPTDTGLFAGDWFPIQVKQTDKVGRIIKLLTVQEILDEEHVQKMWRAAFADAVIRWRTS